jgi:signal transduction histidine kinase
VASATSEPNAHVRRGRHAVEIAALAMIYFGAAKFGFLFAFTTKQVTAVWPPSAVALVAILVRGYRIWPGILLGAFLINAVTEEPLAAAMGIAVGNTLGPLLGALLLRRVTRFDQALTRVRDVLGLLLFGAVLSMTVTATNGVTNLALAHIIPWSAYASVWWVWWVGDAISILLIAPSLLTWVANPRPHWKAWRAVEFAALFATLFFASQIILAGSHHRQIQYAVFPFIIWSALRFGQRETASVILLLSGVAVWGAVHDRGPFAAGTLDERLVLLESFMAIVGVAALVLGAVTSERRLAEDALRQAHDELEERVRERTAEIERLRGEWNSIIAHDLQQPIAAVMTNAQFLSQKIAATSDLHKPAMRIESCARRLSRLARELLDYSLLQTRQLELSRERVDVLQLARASVDLIAPEAPDRRFDVHLRGDVPPVKADSDRIMQVIDNLLTNAVKHGQPGTPILVEVEAANGMVGVSVTNQGVTISAQELSQLFQRFARAGQARERGIKGLGLGLYIVRGLIEAHGGAVVASSTPEGSTTFRFTLPIR